MIEKASPRLRNIKQVTPLASTRRSPLTAAQRTARILRDNAKSHFCTPISKQADTDRNLAIQGRSNSARTQ